MVDTYLYGIGPFVGFWVWRGKRKKNKEILSGTHIVSSNVLKRLIQREGEASLFNLAGVPLIKNKELQHLLIVGTTGAGKTNSVNELLLQNESPPAKPGV